MKRTRIAKKQVLTIAALLVSKAKVENHGGTTVKIDGRSFSKAHYNRAKALIGQIKKKRDMYIEQGKLDPKVKLLEILEVL